jgi:gas vesicle protein
MGTTTRTSPRPTTSRTGRESAAEAREAGGTREEQYDLLTAALIGLVVGIGATALLRRGPRGHRPIGPIVRGAGRGAMWAGKQGARGARWAAERGEEMWDRVPTEEIQDRMQDYMESARDSIGEVVEHEMRDLQKAIRRRRKQLGI